MVTYSKSFLILSLSLGICLSSMFTLRAQNYAHAGEYMTAITQEYEEISQNLWAYMKASAHSKRARKIENKRQELIQATYEVRQKIKRMPGYEGDNSLRDNVAKYLELRYLVLKEDYGKILDMEEIAEQSYDLMEAYLMAKEKADEKVSNAHTLLDEQQKEFAEAHDIRLIEAESTDKLSLRIAKGNEVISYYNPIYLIFFKSYKQEAYLIDAQNAGDVNALEQNKNSLLGFAQEGIAQLDTIKRFDNDASLKTACRNLMNFYIQEANKHVPVITDFFLKKERFERIQKAYSSKKQKDLTQEDVDRYNNAVTEYNAMISKLNKTNEYLNKERGRLLEAWNKAADDFLDRHVP